MGKPHNNVRAKDPLIVKLLGYLFLIAIFVFPAIYYPSFETIMVETFDLQRIEIQLIPVGAILFFLFWKLMDKKVFSPFLALVEAREKATAGSLVDADKIYKQATDVAEKTEAEILQARKDAVKIKNEKILEAKIKVDNSIKDFEQEMLTRLLESRNHLELEVDKINQDLNSSQETLANEIVEKIKVGPQHV